MEGLEKELSEKQAQLDEYKQAAVMTQEVYLSLKAEHETTLLELKDKTDVNVFVFMICFLLR